MNPSHAVILILQWAQVALALGPSWSSSYANIGRLQQSFATRIEPTTITIPIHHEPERGYYVEIKLGTPPQFFKVQIDINRCQGWVLADRDYPYESEKRRNKYKHHMSRSFKSLQHDFGLNYHDRLSIEGELFKERLTLGNISIPDRIFGLAHLIQGRLLRVIQFDGVLGLGMINWDKKTDTNLVRYMYDSGIIPDLVFSIHLNKNTRYSPAGSLLLGTVDENLSKGPFQYFQGEIILNHVNVSWPASEQSDARSEQVEGYDYVSFDLTTELIHTSMARQINSELGAFEDKEFAPFHRFEDCDPLTKPNMTFIMNELMFTLTPNEYLLKVIIDEEDTKDPDGINTICYSPVVGVPYGRQSKFGTIFMKKFYMTFNHATSKVGLAEAI